MLILTYKGTSYQISSIDSALEALGGMAKVFAVDTSAEITYITLKDGSVATVS